MSLSALLCVSLKSTLIPTLLILVIVHCHSHLSCGVGRSGHSIHHDHLCCRSGMLASDCRLGDHWQHGQLQFHRANPCKSFRFVLIFQQRLSFLSIGVGFVDLWFGRSSMNTSGSGLRFLSPCLCISCFTSGCVVKLPLLVRLGGV